MSKWLNAIAKAKRPRWLQDEGCQKCAGCQDGFSALNRRHHCRSCGNLYCATCAPEEGIPLPGLGYREPVRACLACVQRSKGGGKPKPPRPAGTAPHQARHEKPAPAQQQQANPHVRTNNPSPPENEGRGPFLPRFMNDRPSSKPTSSMDRLREKVERHKAAKTGGFQGWLS